MEVKGTHKKSALSGQTPRERSRLRTVLWDLRLYFSGRGGPSEGNWAEWTGKEEERKEMGVRTKQIRWRDDKW